MTTRRVTAPDGTTWSVRRRWLPHQEGRGVRERWRRRPQTDGLGDGLGLAGDLAEIPAVGIVAAVVAAIVFVVLMTIWFPFVVLLGIDLLWLAVVGVSGVVGRTILRRPWTVEAVGDHERRTWLVDGFRATGRRRDELADGFRHGRNPNPAVGPLLPD